MRVNSRTVGGALARALEFQQATLELVTERVEAIDQGLVVRHSALPFVWSANHVRITEPVTFAQALELAETHLGDLPIPVYVYTTYRHGVRADEPGR